MDSAWDRLLELFDHVAADPDRPLPDDLEQTFAHLSTEAMADHVIDRELHVPDIARWLVALVVAQRVVHETHPGPGPEADLAVLRVIVTRWLHPARPR